MTPEDLKKRSKQFALSVFDLLDDLPNSTKKVEAKKSKIKDQK